ncbi:Aste57867_9671 [Aphanomyces stellatus]|uniref:Aste57867_9671 protein n=1 Tax=Aphanomyces stellatus TaxID=120398 RepID=A0A485KNE7_9STRA|nr:hypothetical protein As57867_009633 [Aphanomyces stellatus]VFT86550.1 Aste57867_9671 [Aphanomyces stellatus]
MVGQPHSDILFFGTLDKRRDGAVRGGWATRLFLLTPQWLVYFRVTNKLELLGEERERVALSSITNVRVAPEEEVPPGAIEVPREFSYIEIQLDTPSKMLLMRTSKKQSISSQHWVAVIENQRQLHLNPAVNVRMPILKLPSQPIASPKPQKHLVEQTVVMVIMVDDNTDREEFVVAKKIDYGEHINLGVVKQARIGTQALMGSWDANETCWVECLGSKSLTEVEVSVMCHVVKQNPKIPSSPMVKRNPSVQSNYAWIGLAEEGASMGFLLMAMLVHFMCSISHINPDEYFKLEVLSSETTDSSNEFILNS